MRTVLLGTDFMYDGNGVLKPIETNTAIGTSLNKVEKEQDIYDFTELNNFINSNGFVKLVYIGNSDKIKNHLSSSFTNIEFEYYRILNGSITIPVVEDSETTLIIRSAYDTTALVDDTYCRDKVEFLKLIQNESYGSQFAYKDDSGNLVSTITTIEDNGVHPNFILKSRYPNYDKNVWPKLYKISTQEELNTLLESVDENYFLMPYYFNSDKIYDNKVTKIRSLNLLYPPTLQSIPIGTYTDLTTRYIQSNPTYNSTTHQLDDWYKDCYISGEINIITPKLLDTDLVQLADGTFVTAMDLQVGAEIKAIQIPNAENVNIIDETVNYHIPLSEFMSGSTYVTNTIVGKKRVDVDAKMAIITFTDSTDWQDTANSSYLVEKDNELRFVKVKDLMAGDKVILIDTTNPTQVQCVVKTVSTIQQTTSVFSGWLIDTETQNIFLTKTDNSQDLINFAAVEHNLLPCPGYTCYCVQGNCPKNHYCSGYGDCRTYPYLCC